VAKATGSQESAKKIWVVGVPMGRGKQPEGMFDFNDKKEEQVSCQRWSRKDLSRHKLLVEQSLRFLVRVRVLLPPRPIVQILLLAPCNNVLQRMSRRGKSCQSRLPPPCGGLGWEVRTSRLRNQGGLPKEGGPIRERWASLAIYLRDHAGNSSRLAITGSHGLSTYLRKMPF
jgi:hypothetical protein